MHPRPIAGSARALLVGAGIAAAVLLSAPVLASCGGRDEAVGGGPDTAATAAPAPGSAPPQLTGGGLPPGCRCHSHVKWQVAMHELFSVRDCAACHSADEDLMATQSTTMTAAHLDALKARMRSDPVCLECHKKGGTSVAARFTAMKGRLYCPTDGTTYARGQAVSRDDASFCPADGAKLVDIDAVTGASEQEPDNAHCVACHPRTAALDQQHAGVAGAAGVSDLSDCLSCHPSHSECGSCHH